MKMMIEKTCNRESEIQRKKKTKKNEKQNAEIVMIMK
jgi:hypothetical protein